MIHIKHKNLRENAPFIYGNQKFIF